MIYKLFYKHSYIPINTNVTLAAFSVVVRKTSFATFLYVPTRSILTDVASLSDFSSSNLLTIWAELRYTRDSCSIERQITSRRLQRLLEQLKKLENNISIGKKVHDSILT